MPVAVYRRRSLPRRGNSRRAPRKRGLYGSFRALAAGTISFVTKNNAAIGLSATDATGGVGPYSYQWYRSASSGFTPGAGNILSGQTALTLSDTGLAADTTYYYVLRYTDSAASTVDATELGVTTDFSGGAGGGSIFGSNILGGIL